MKGSRRRSKMQSKILGTATIEPGGDFSVCEKGTWRISYTTGDYGMDDGASILIAQRDMTDAMPLQSDDPEKPGFVSGHTDGDARIEVSYDPWRWTRPWRGAIIAKVRDGSLRPGEGIEVVLGDRSGGSPGWILQTFPESRHEFRILVDPFGTRSYRPIEQSPHIRIIPGQPESIDAILRSTVGPSEEVQVIVRALDGHGNPVGDFSGEVEAILDPPFESASSVFQLKSGTDGDQVISFPDEGEYRLKLRCGDLVGESNPVRVAKDQDSVFWVDLHGQTEDTIGTGTIDEYFRYARDSAHVDATCWQGNDFQVTPRTWGEVCAKTREYDRPGSFVTFLGYEWSGPTPLGGDHNIMFLKDDQPICRSSLWLLEDPSGEREFFPINELWEEFEGRRDVMAVAHVGGRYANLEYWNPKFCGLVEICSNHGVFEWLVKDALRRGLRVGVVAGSDDHSGRPGWSPPLRRGGLRGTVRLDLFGGLTCIYSQELTREGIWNALRSRHCYGTTGKRILLDVRSGEKMMGDAVGNEEINISVGVVGTSPLLDVEVIRDDEVVHRYPLSEPSGPEWIRIEWSGQRVKSRNRRTTWAGRIRVNGGRIEELLQIGFWREGDGIHRISPEEVEFESTTAGDTIGVFLRLTGGVSRIRFESPLITRDVQVSELNVEPLECDAGGLNQRLRFRLDCPTDRPSHLDFTYSETDPPSGEHAYWIRVLQMDGHGAWSSPIYFTSQRAA